MTESDFSKKVKGHLEAVFSPPYKVSSGENLQHSIIFDRSGEVWPGELKALRSKKLYAYQVDIVLSNGTVPLVAVELKCGSGSGYTTHDVLTYSAKAARHKELYPYLRYGMAIGGVPSIGRKFFFTNRALDFVVAIPEDSELPRLAKVVQHQMKLAEDALEILRRDSKPRVRCWQNGLTWEWTKQAPTENDPEEGD